MESPAMSSIINLVRTSQGYSLVQGDGQSFTNAPRPSRACPPRRSTVHSFTIYPGIPLADSDQPKVVIGPSGASWFSLNAVHQIEIKAFPEWFRIRRGTQALAHASKFEKNDQVYRKYRNYIIHLGSNQYVTATAARKGLAGDAGSINRIHTFLAKWGLINQQFRKPSSVNSHLQRPLLKSEPNEHQKQGLNIYPDESQLGAQLVLKQTSTPNQYAIQPIKMSRFLRDSFDDHRLATSYPQGQIQILKNSTQHLRPICKFCMSLCGATWYQFKQSINLKGLAQRFLSFDQNNRQTKAISLTFCSNCVLERRYPFVLRLEDLTLKKIADLIDLTNFEAGNRCDGLRIQLTDSPLGEAKTHETTQNKPLSINSHRSSGSKQTTDDNSMSHFERQERLKRYLEKATRSTSDCKQAYKVYLHTWLETVSLKLEQLKQWDQSVRWLGEYVVTMQKHQLASTVEASLK